MKKLLYTLMCCCTLISCTDLEPERYDAINPGFFPKTEKDAEALITGGVYAPFRCDNYSGIFNDIAFYVLKSMDNQCCKNSQSFCTASAR